MMRGPSRFFYVAQKSSRAFTLIELLIVIAIIGILSALIVAAITNSTEDTRLVLARQQLAVTQEALNAWVARECATNSVATVRSNYNAAGNRFDFLRPYLDDRTVEHFDLFSGTNQVRSEAMAKTGRYLSFPNWAEGSYPKVDLEEAP